ncbi:dehydrogenase [Caballeronia terrestris]|uniref:Dehydrogenase n=1 Tax=Caballeronia terrestris TaxID=1226301 RepID=A0A158IQN9_9BURK|nr:SDR family oxidoreductase [Caballeronia terrestris]SAL58603.1 dehydrogenase [Caballeronia terrestris]
MSASPSVFTSSRPRVVLVTGAAKRIGRGVALGFASRGWDVAVHYGESEREAHETVAEIAALGCRAVALRADLGVETQVARLVPACIEAFGGLNCVVNCASRFDEDTAQDFRYAKLLEMTAINLAAPLTLARALHETVPDAAIDDETQRGVVINVLDQKLYNMNPDYLSYTLTKAALENATVALAQALAPKLRVVGLAPGLTMVSANQTPADFEMAHRVTPLGRASRVEDIAEAACYLATAHGVTGTTLVVDGGQHLVPSPRDVMFMIRDKR